MSVGVDHSDIFKRSWANLQVHAIAGIVLTLLILAAMEQILRTEEKARQKAEQLQLTLENMSQGIMLVTKDLQIPIINGRCGELLDLPPNISSIRRASTSSWKSSPRSGRSPTL